MSDHKEVEAFGPRCVAEHFTTLELADRLRYAVDLIDAAKDVARVLATMRDDAFDTECEGVPAHVYALATRALGQRMYDLTHAAQRLLDDPAYTEGDAFGVLHGAG